MGCKSGDRIIADVLMDSDLIESHTRSLRIVGFALE
jgi:hypothetical protein